MDLQHPDVVPEFNENNLYQMRLKFEDKTVISPSDIFEQVQKLIKDNTKEIKPKVGRLGQLFVSHGGPGASLFFTYGFYFRKAVESLEKQHGKCEVQFDTEEVSNEQIKTFVSSYLNKQADKMKTLATSIMKDGLPDDLFGED